MQGQQGGGTGIIPIAQGDVANVAKMTGMKVEQVHPFVVAYGDGKGGMRPYVTTPGKRFKMDERFGAGGYDVKTTLPTEQEYAFLCRMMGIKKDAPCIIIKCEIWVDGKVKYSDYGTASPVNMYPDLFNKRGLEIATTRAINRAMDQGIAKGFSDTNKRYEHTLFGYKLDFVKTCENYKKKLGDDKYYAILLQYGVQHCNDPNLVSDPLMMEMVVNDLEKAFGIEQPQEMTQEEAIDAIYGEAKEETKEQEVVEPVVEVIKDDASAFADVEAENKLREDLIFEIGEAVLRGKMSNEDAEKAKRLINMGKVDEAKMKEKIEKLKTEREKAESAGEQPSF